MTLLVLKTGVRQSRVRINLAVLVVLEPVSVCMCSLSFATFCSAPKETSNVCFFHTTRNFSDSSVSCASVANTNMANKYRLQSSVADLKSSLQTRHEALHPLRPLRSPPPSRGARLLTQQTEVRVQNQNLAITTHAPDSKVWRDGWCTSVPSPRLPSIFLSEVLGNKSSHKCSTCTRPPRSLIGT